MPIISFL